MYIVALIALAAIYSGLTLSAIIGASRSADAGWRSV